MQFLKIESTLKVMKNAFYFILKLFRSQDIYIFDFVEKRLDKKGKVNFKIRGVTNYETRNYNTYITQYLKK